MECLAEQRPQLGKGLASCDDDAGWRRGTAETRSVIPTQPTHIPTAPRDQGKQTQGRSARSPVHPPNSICLFPSRPGHRALPGSSHISPYLLFASTLAFVQVFQGPPDSLFGGGAADEGDRHNERSATGGREALTAQALGRTADPERPLSDF